MVGVRMVQAAMLDGDLGDTFYWTFLLHGLLVQYSVLVYRYYVIVSSVIVVAGITAW